jgi:peptidoglycan-N-acetylglucosamine deacetylase
MRPDQKKYTPALQASSRPAHNFFSPSGSFPPSLQSVPVALHTECRMLSPLAIGISAGAGAIAALGLAAGGFAYAARWPASHIFGNALLAPHRPGEIALTFDDGPNPLWTPHMLEILAKNNLHATFFLVGGFAQREPALVRQMVDAGHLIGNHSWSHIDLAIAKTSRIREELSRTCHELEQITGQPVRFFRPPFGSRRPAVWRIAREMGMQPVLWNAMTSDWNLTSSQTIADRLATKIDRLERRGLATTLVLHDGNHLNQTADRQYSAAALELLIARYAASHRFVTLDAWN